MKIVGTGRQLPKRKILSSDLDRLYEKEAGFFATSTGVQTRYFCDDESQIDLAVAASNKALSDAGLLPSNVDLIISAAAVPYQPIPATAPAIQRSLGIGDGECFSLDINCTCLGFLAALQMADSLIRERKYQTILIVSSEVASRALPWATQPEVAGLFGDGAAAAVLSSSADNGISATSFETYPSAYQACELASGGTRFDFEKQFALFSAHSRFAMDGKELFRLTAKHFGKFVGGLLENANTERAQVDRVIAHQASPGALVHMIKLCGFETEQVVNIASQVGNQIAASIPFTLDYAREHKLVKKGDRILMLGTSAGVSFGGVVMDF